MSVETLGQTIGQTAMHPYADDAVLAAAPNGVAIPTAPAVPAAPVVAPEPEELPILTVRNVAKRFEQTQAVQDISVEVFPGEIFALIGPNGAGKTTFANMLMGNITPDQGSIVFTLDGKRLTRLSDREIGYFPGESMVYKNLTVYKALYHSGVLRGLSAEEAQAATEQWLDRMGMKSRSQAVFSSLSRGNQQKIQFAEALMHGPKIVFLDEPFAGLDPVTQELFIEVIRELQASGITLLISDHQMSLIERLADCVCILNMGQVVALGTLDELRQVARAGIRIRARLANPKADPNLSFLYTHPGVRLVERTKGGEVRIFTYEDASLVEVSNFAKANLRITEIISEPANLHEVYIQCIRNHMNRIDAEEGARVWRKPL
jgi:ABC-2 type transport system ATP-binding protein